MVVAVATTVIAMMAAIVAVLTTITIIGHSATE